MNAKGHEQSQRVEDVQWCSRRGKEAGEHAGTFPSCYNEDCQCQGLGVCSPALVFQGTIRALGVSASPSHPSGSFPMQKLPARPWNPRTFSGTLVSLMTLGHHAVLYFFLLIFYHWPRCAVFSQQQVTPMLWWQQRQFLLGFWLDIPTK